MHIFSIRPLLIYCSDESITAEDGLNRENTFMRYKLQAAFNDVQSVLW